MCIFCAFSIHLYRLRAISAQDVVKTMNLVDIFESCSPFGECFIKFLVSKGVAELK